MSEVVLGALAEGHTERDAIHLAVIPMKASGRLMPGQQVGIVSDGVAGCAAPAIGIVDPFLQVGPSNGQTFWVCLFPGTVTGMRHHWQHPAFGGTPASERELSIAWLKDAAEQLDVSYETLVGDSDLIHADYINNGETIRNIWLGIQEDYWKHRKIVTGEDVSEDDRGGFTCSC